MEKVRVVYKTNVFITLGIVFILLKALNVTAVAEWSWVWVLCPIWAPFALWAVITLIGLIFVVIGTLFGRK